MPQVVLAFCSCWPVLSRPECSWPRRPRLATPAFDAGGPVPSTSRLMCLPTRPASPYPLQNWLRRTLALDLSSHDISCSHFFLRYEVLLAYRENILSNDDLIITFSNQTLGRTPRQNEVSRP
jgi:hypothetical protein